jgi:RING finger/CHY zinc finger protein 1
LKQDCPVCMYDMFSSRDTAAFLKCGHAMHNKCFKQYIKSNNTTCPFCSKSFIDDAEYSKVVEEAIASTPMPEEYKDKKV